MAGGKHRNVSMLQQGLKNFFLHNFTTFQTSAELRSHQRPSPWLFIVFIMPMQCGIKSTRRLTDFEKKADDLPTFGPVEKSPQRWNHNRQFWTKVVGLSDLVWQYFSRWPSR
jgi:hypothetical protein